MEIYERFEKSMRINWRKFDGEPPAERLYLTLQEIQDIDWPVKWALEAYFEGEKSDLAHEGFVLWMKCLEMVKAFSIQDNPFGEINA